MIISLVSVSPCKPYLVDICRLCSSCLIDPSSSSILPLPIYPSSKGRDPVEIFNLGSLLALHLFVSVSAPIKCQKKPL